MTVRRKTYNLAYARAFKIISNGKASIAVIASEHPFEMSNTRMESRPKARFIDPYSIIILSTSSEGEPIRHTQSHVQAVFDEETGRLTSYQCFADGAIFRGIQSKPTNKVDAVTKPRYLTDPPKSWTAKIEGKRIVGAVDKEQFKFEFETTIEDFKVPADPKPSD
jgi:hypothetical protein